MGARIGPTSSSRLPVCDTSHFHWKYPPPSVSGGDRGNPVAALVAVILSPPMPCELTWEVGGLQEKTDGALAGPIDVTGGGVVRRDTPGLVQSQLYNSSLCDGAGEGGIGDYRELPAFSCGLGGVRHCAVVGVDGPKELNESVVVVRRPDPCYTRLCVVLGALVKYSLLNFILLESFYAVTFYLARSFTKRI